MNGPRTFLIGIFLFACALVDGVLVVTSAGAARSVDALLLVGLALGQACVAAIWLVFGGNSLLGRFWRFLAVVALLTAPVALATALDGREAFGVLVILTAFVAAPLAAFRPKSAVVNREGGAARTDDNRGPFVAGRSFSLKSLLLLMLAFALVFGARRWTSLPSPIVAAQCLGLALAAVLTWFSIGGSGPLALRISLGAALCLALGWFVAMSDAIWRPLVIVAIAEVAMVAAGAIVLRVAVWKSRSTIHPEAIDIGERHT